MRGTQKKTRASGTRTANRSSTQRSKGTRSQSSTAASGSRRTAAQPRSQVRSFSQRGYGMNAQSGRDYDHLSSDRMTHSYRPESYENDDRNSMGRSRFYPEARDWDHRHEERRDDRRSGGRFDQGYGRDYEDVGYGRQSPSPDRGQGYVDEHSGEGRRGRDMDRYRRDSNDDGRFSPRERSYDSHRSTRHY